MPISGRSRESLDFLVSFSFPPFFREAADARFLGPDIVSTNFQSIRGAFPFHHWFWESISSVGTNSNVTLSNVSIYPFLTWFPVATRLRFQTYDVVNNIFCQGILSKFFSAILLVENASVVENLVFSFL